MPAGSLGSSPRAALAQSVGHWRGLDPVGWLTLCPGLRVLLVGCDAGGAWLAIDRARLGVCARHVVDLAQVPGHRPEHEEQDHAHAEHDKEAERAWLIEQRRRRLRRQVE